MALQRSDLEQIKSMLAADAQLAFGLLCIPRITQRLILRMQKAAVSFEIEPFVFAVTFFGFPLFCCSACVRLDAKGGRDQL